MAGRTTHNLRACMPLIHIYYNKDYTTSKDRWVLIVDGIRQLSGSVVINIPCYTSTCKDETGTMRYCVSCEGELLVEGDGAIIN